MQLFLRGCGLCDYRIFSKTPPSPLNLKRGSTSPPAPSPQERSPTGKPAVLYSQTSFNFVDFRLHSAEHSSELDALLSLARELRVFDAHSAIFYAPMAPVRIG